VVAQFYLDSEGQHNPIQFAEIFAKMVSQLLLDFEPVNIAMCML